LISDFTLFVALISCGDHWNAVVLMVDDDDD